MHFKTHLFDIQRQINEQNILKSYQFISQPTNEKRHVAEETSYPTIRITFSTNQRRESHVTVGIFHQLEEKQSTIGKNGNAVAILHSIYQKSGWESCHKIGNATIERDALLTKNCNTTIERDALVVKKLQCNNRKRCIGVKKLLCNNRKRCIIESQNYNATPKRDALGRKITMQH